MKLGLLSQKQYKVLKLRSNGLTQLEIAKELGTTRANVSMVEWRARRKIEKARETLHAFELMQSSYNVVVEKGAKLAEIPLEVLHEGDRRRIRVKSNIVEIVRMVKVLKPNCIRDGKLIRRLTISMNERGKLTFSS